MHPTLAQQIGRDRQLAAVDEATRSRGRPAGRVGRRALTRWAGLTLVRLGRRLAGPDDLYDRRAAARWRPS
ncbi:MAG TPA: hypothetical protein VKG43_10490 [Acidimicrobiales bacterium]|nr:hypothetical protein [Acidimicrobiales bacterium]